MRKTSLALFLAIGLIAGSPVIAGEGSWVVSLDSVRLAVAGRVREIELVPPAKESTDAEIRRFRWRYEVPAGRSIRARLCRGEHCRVLEPSRGYIDAPFPPGASGPLVLRMSLPAGSALRVQDIQLIVDYQSGD